MWYVGLDWSDTHHDMVLLDEAGHRVDVKGTAQRGTWVWRRVAVSLLLALLALGFVGLGTGLASSAAAQRPATVSSQQADAAPAMMAWKGILFVGWTGRNAAHNLNLMTYTPSSKVFGPAQVLTDTTLPGQGPSLANLNGNLYVAWMGSDHHLNVGRYDLSHPSVLSGKVTLRESSRSSRWCVRSDPAPLKGAGLMRHPTGRAIRCASTASTVHMCAQSEKI